MKSALISVSDKTGIIDFAKGLATHGYRLISTGGTHRALQEAGLDVVGISEVTDFPEILDGRVKTLHPNVHAGILAMDKPEHMDVLEAHHIQTIDMVVVNLYPFAETIAKPDVTLAQAIENIDIGGPCMVRASAKNNKYVAIVTNPDKYGEIISILKKDLFSCFINKILISCTGSCRFPNTTLWNG